METRWEKFCLRCGGLLQEQWVEAEGRERPLCQACGFILYRNPKVVAGVIPSQDGRVLLLRRMIEPARGKWTFPAGFVELGESVEEAAIRETREEVSVEISELSLLNVYSYRESPVVTVVYLSRIVGGNPQAGEEAEEVAFFTPEALPWEDLAFWSTRDALKDWVRRLKHH
ncbi:MAG: NUDIX domain-containing protein [Candidatus Methylomirabilales bacterium]